MVKIDFSCGLFQGLMKRDAMMKEKFSAHFEISAAILSIINIISKWYLLYSESNYGRSYKRKE